MTQSFDAGRWWLLVGKHWSENRKKYTLSIIAIAGLLLLWFLILLLMDMQKGSSYNGLDASLQSATYFTGLFLGGCAFGSVLFAELGSKTKGLNYLSVPASHLEKLLCSLFYGVIVFFVLYTLIFYAVDTIMIKAGNAVSYSHWLKNHSTSVFRGQKIANVFYNPENSSKENILFYILLLYFVVQSIFILGSVYFIHFGFIKTVIAALLTGALVVFIIAKLIAPILPAGSYYHGITSYQVFTTQSTGGNGIMIYSDVNTDKLVSIPGWIGDLLLFLLKYSIAPLLWLVTYYRLKEKEI